MIVVYIVADLVARVARIVVEKLNEPVEVTYIWSCI
jgi:phenylpyruvate tautomerase PptA (4-oxalocrotonate tautomerase family)